MSAVLSTSIYIGLVLVLWMPLIVTPETPFPFIVGKALYARGLVEIITALWVVLLLWNPSHRPPRSWVLIAFAAYVVVAILSAASGVSFNRSIWSTHERMMGVWGLAHWFLFVVVAASMMRSPRAWRALLNWNLGAALVLSLLALAQAYRVPVFPYLLPQRRLDATLGNPSFLAAILAVTTLVAVGFLARSFLRAQGEGPESPGKSPPPPGSKASGWREWRRLPAARWLRSHALLWRRIFWVVVALLGLWVLFQTGTRGALVGLVGGAVAMPVALAIWGNRRALRPVALAAGGTLLAVTALFAVDQTLGLPVTPVRQEQVTSARLIRTSVQEGSVATRLASAKVGIRAFLERPLLGWGPENYTAAFDRFAEASIYKYSSVPFDQAHNKVVEELSTKGALGTLSYLALWAVLGWAVIRRRRPPREEILAYAILGALAAYFIQNLFLFDTPAMMLQWSLLMAWVAGQEQAPPIKGQKPGAGSRAQEAGASPQPPGSPTPRTRSSLWSRGGLAAATVALLGLSLYFLNYQPYAAARTFGEFVDERGTAAEQLALAQKSFDTFPPLATLPRQVTFGWLSLRWASFSSQERQQALEFLARESVRAFQAEPQNARPLMAALPVLQVAAASSPEALEQLEPLLQRLQELAPQRVQTYTRLAAQEIFKGNYREALRIAEEFEALAPNTEPFFQNIKQLAREGLVAEGAGG